MKHSLYRYSIPTQCPWLKRREGALICLESIEGNHWAEIAPLPKFSEETLEEAIDDVKQSLQKEKPESACSPSAQWALQSLEIASNQIKVKSYGLIDFSPFGQKIKLNGLSLVDAILITKKALKKNKVIADINQAWTREKTLRFCDNFKPEDFIYIEEPVSCIEDLKFLLETGYPFAVDEMTRKHSIGFLLNECPKLKAFVLKPSLTGRIKEISLLKKSKKLITLSSSYESPIGLAAIANFASHHNISSVLGINTFKNNEETFMQEPLHFNRGIIKFKENTLNLLSSNLWPL